MQTVAEYMADIFEENRGEDGVIDVDTYVEISQVFGAVPEEFRGHVFMEFLEELNKRDIDYDVTQFQNDDVEIVH